MRVNMPLIVLYMRENKCKRHDIQQVITVYVRHTHVV